MGDVSVVGLGHAGRGDAKTEEAGVQACEFGLDRGVVGEIRQDEFSKFGVGLCGWSADDGRDLIHIGIEQALAQNALADHPGCSEEKYVHLLPLGSNVTQPQNIALSRKISH